MIKSFFPIFLFQSLLLLTYLVKNGSERVVTSTREHIYDLRSLENYTYTDEYGKDQGINGTYIIIILLLFTYLKLAILISA